MVGSPFIEAWAKLLSLSLRLRVTEEEIAGVPYLLMHSCPNVKTLSLDCDSGEHAGQLLQYMAQNRMNAKWKLEEIFLWKITVTDVEDLGFFLQHHRRTLRKLKLHSITSTSHSSGPESLHFSAITSLDSRASKSVICAISATYGD
ncbi:hypothetical protein BJX65DRAFT_301913 [Aspergillus insuetus]